MSGLELVCAVALVVPIFDKRAAILAPIAAACVGAEMLFFSGVHLASGAAGIGRLVRKPMRRGRVTFS